MSSKQRRVAIVVQHLLGAGHLIRAMLLAESLAKAGHQVILFSGGFAIEGAIKGYQFFQLPATRAKNADFTHLVDTDGNAISQTWRNTRAKILLSQVKIFQPNLVITETYPFGRRQFRFELEPLIKWAHKQKKVQLLASIRDILQRRTTKKNLETVSIIEQYYDGVLIHGDEQLFNLQASFEFSQKIQSYLHYTGYIQPQRNIQPELSGFGQDEVIVAGGTGKVSAQLLKTSHATRTLSDASLKTWRLLTGLPLNTLGVKTQNNLILEKNRPDYFALLSRCALSISQAGYNTSLDILSSGARSVMVPFSQNGETEQTDRAKALAQAGRVIYLAESELTPLTLAKAVNQALQMPVKNLSINTHGASNSAIFIAQLLNK